MMEEAFAMKMILRKLVLIIVCASVFVLSACGVSSQHAKAIEQAIIGYSDYYIEVRNLSDQVETGYQLIDSKQSAVTYTITANIPDYTSADFQRVQYTLPAPDLNAKSTVLYQKKAVLAIRQVLETYALNNSVSTYLDVPITFDVVSGGSGWAASMKGTSKTQIQQTVETIMLSLLEKSADYQQYYRTALVSDELSMLLSDAMGGAEYAALVDIQSITQNTDGSYIAALSYPDPVGVFTALGTAYVASFNQSFYGDPLKVSLTADGLGQLNTAGITRVKDNVTVSLNTETNTAELIDAASLLTRISEAKQAADESASAAVNAAWRIAPQEPPESGTVLEGTSSGNQIVFKTGATLGSYYYVRFYAISSEDTSEEGALTAGMFIIGGKTAKIDLPSGYYRVACFVGENWYGLDTLFGKDGKQYEGRSAITSREGYINTVSFQ